MTNLLSILLPLFLLSILIASCEKSNAKNKRKKSLLDYNEADLERLYEEWEENDDEPLEPDELPEYKKPPPQIDMSQINLGDPESLLKMTKKGKTLMAFVTVSGNPTREQTDELTGLWQSSLQNNHIIAERFLIDDNRAIFMFKDGAQAWDAKEFFVNQKRMKEVSIENKPYPGKYPDSKEEL